MEEKLSTDQSAPKTLRFRLVSGHQHQILVAPAGFLTSLTSKAYGQPA